MPFSPSGVFTPAVTFSPNSYATAEDQNTQDSDIATGLTGCMTRAGLAPPTANLPMGGFKLTNLGPGSGSADSVTYGQLQALQTLLETLLAANMPSGTILAFGGSTVPAGFLLCYGQTVSQSSYPNLWAVLGTTWGTSSGNVVLPDLRGIVVAGADNMGGSAANRLTGYVVGSKGGTQNITLAAAQLPASAYTTPAHTHTITEPNGGQGHLHTYIEPTGTGSSAAPGNISSITTGNTGYSTTGITVNNASLTITNQAAVPTQSTTPLVQPTAAMNWIIKT